MINRKLIYKVLGQLLFIEAFLLFVSLLVAFYYQQDDIFAFIVATLTTIGGGLVLKWRGHGADNSMSRRDAYLVVTLSWIVFSFFGTLPFMISGYINNFTDAYFETMSGFTTTGATILDDVECFPPRTAFLAFAHPMDRRSGNRVLHHRPAAIACRRTDQGVCCRGYRTYQDKTASPAFHFG